MNGKEILIQAITAVPNGDLFTLSQSLTCEISTASLVCILGQRVNALNTCMEMLAGINEPYTGSINYSDNLLNKENNNYSKIGYIYHNSTLLSTLNGIDNVKIPALYHHLGSIKEINKEVDILLGELEHEANHKLLPAFMDSLQKRHLLIIRAIMLKPKILFIENPFMGLDREEVWVLGEYIAGLAKNKNITVITSNVNLNFVQYHANQIIYLASEDIHVFKGRDAFSNYIKVTST